MKQKHDIFYKIIIIFLLLSLIVTFLFAEIPIEDDFTIIVLPDTQKYCEFNLNGFKDQTEWIVANREALNIVYVAHVGDVVQHASNTSEWDRAEQALEVLEDPATTGLTDGIPYGMSPGNHDIPTGVNNPLFDISRFSGRNYFGGTYYYDDNDMNNSYNYFSAGSTDFIVLHLSFAYATTPGAVLDWANNILTAHPNHKAIVVNHSILHTGTNASFTTDGSTLYEAIKDNSNLLLMLAGHVPGEGRRTDIYKGNIVHSLLADYQSESNGGNSWLRILTFSPANKQIRVQTYSPTLNQFKTTSSSYFILDYDGELANWHCNESTGSSMVADSAFDFDGITAATRTTGIAGNGLDLDGIDDYADMGDLPEMESMDQVSLSAWIYPTSIGTSNDFIMGKEFVYKIDVRSNGKVRFLTSTTNGVWANTILYSNTVLQNNKWYHIAATYDGTIKKLYINGTIDATKAVTGTLLANSKHVTIGAYYYKSGIYSSHFKGTIDEARIYPRAITQEEIYALYGKKAHWTFNETSGTTVKDDIYTYNGTISGASRTSGKFGNGLYFDGVNDYVDMGDVSALEGMEQLTLSAWVYPNAIGSSNDFIMGKEFVYKIDIRSNGIVRFLTATTGGSWGTTILYSTSALENNKWHHIVATYDGTVKRLYINGVLDSVLSTSGNLVTNSKHVTVGAYYYAAGSFRSYFRGKIDDVRIYNKAVQP